MPRSLHVRLDDTSAAALEVVRAGEMTDSEAVRTALREAAARRRARSALREEVRRLVADEGDREEISHGVIYLPAARLGIRCGCR